MGTPEARAEILNSAELELLDGSFGTTELSGDFAGAALLDETVDDDAALIRRKAVDELEEHGVSFGFVERGFVLGITPGIDLFFRGGVPAVDDGVGGHAEQPGEEGNAAPLKAREVGERLMEHFGRQVFGLFAVANTARDEGVDTVEVKLVELGEAARVALRGLDEQPFAGRVLASF
jgi:hypothetical protein